jgi:hypothetical protein
VSALTIMAETPRPRAVKTRLPPPLTPNQATGLSVCFLQDTAENGESCRRGCLGLGGESTAEEHARSTHEAGAEQHEAAWFRSCAEGVRTVKVET